LLLKHLSIPTLLTLSAIDSKHTWEQSRGQLASI
jgi:hypothetical protein